MAGDELFPVGDAWLGDTYGGVRDVEFYEDDTLKYRI
jgi:hypothetical protein